MRLLITGATGFAGAHLTRCCEEAGDTVTPAGSALADLRDPAATRALVAAARPSAVVHLAAQAHVGRSWRDPAPTLRDNVLMTLHVLEAVRAEAPDAVVMLASSSEVYGPPEKLPVDEAAPLRPQNPYAVSKAAADLLGGMYADAHGVHVVRARAFNHAGPGQEPLYAIASFTRQVAAGLEAGADPIVVRTGNPDTRRDFTDVRDVVRAYRLLASGEIEPGVLNIASGEAVSGGEIIAMLQSIADVAIDHRIDASLVRAHEVMELRGSAARLRELTGWSPAIGLERTLADTVAWWREEIRAGRADGRLTE
jgi:GDP-4-dehydro-6-deoxy-D-mannose reductase